MQVKRNKRKILEAKHSNRKKYKESVEEFLGVLEFETVDARTQINCAEVLSSVTFEEIGRSCRAQRAPGTIGKAMFL